MRPHAERVPTEAGKLKPNFYSYCTCANIREIFANIPGTGAKFRIKYIPKKNEYLTQAYRLLLRAGTTTNASSAYPSPAGYMGRWPLQGCAPGGRRAAEALRLTQTQIDERERYAHRMRAALTGTTRTHPSSPCAGTRACYRGREKEESTRVRVGWVVERAQGASACLFVERGRQIVAKPEEHSTYAGKAERARSCCMFHSSG